MQTRFDSAEDPVQMATRDQILVSMGMELPKDQMYERHKIRVPEIGEDVITAPAAADPFAGKEPIKAKKSKVEAKAIPTKDDKLTDSVMEQLTGVNAEWLGPVRPIFDKMISLAESEEVSDEELKKAVETLAEEMPELFDQINHEALQEALEEAMGSAAANGAFERINDYNMDNPEDA